MTCPGSRNPQAKLTEADVQRIRTIWRTTPLSLEAIGRQFGVSKMTVSRIVSGRTWRHV